MEFEKLTAVLDRIGKELGIPGQSCSVMINDETVYSYYNGLADIESGRPIREDTIFRIFSMSKPVTVTAAMQLYEKGLFDINDPVYKYLPEFKEAKMYHCSESGVRSAVPLIRPLRIMDLLTCTGGFTYYNEKKPGEASTLSAVAASTTQTADELSKIMFEINEKYPGKTYTNRDFAKAAAQVPLAFQPGSHWMYSRGFDILGAVVEVLADMPLDEYVKQNICMPLGLADTGYRLNAEQESRLCTFYDITDKAQPRAIRDEDERYKPSAKLSEGGTGMVSTLPEYMRFANTLQRGGTSPDGVRLLGRKTVELMTMNHLGPVQRKDINWPSLQGYGYGFGVRVLLDKTPCGSLSSLGEWGWSGRAGTWMACDPAEHLTVCFMKQTFPAYEGWIVQRFKPALWSLL